MKYKVIGTLPICGTDGEDVVKPGMVDLDPTVTRIPELIQAGLIEEIRQPVKKPGGEK